MGSRPSHLTFLYPGASEEAPRDPQSPSEHWARKGTLSASHRVASQKGRSSAGQLVLAASKAPAPLLSCDKAMQASWEESWGWLQKLG